jgi:hypothetical protein
VLSENYKPSGDSSKWSQHSDGLVQSVWISNRHECTILGFNHVMSNAPSG